MRNSVYIFFFLISSFLILNAQEAPYFASTPSLSPDGKQVYFSYDGDIWKVPANGGEALRITALQGNATAPKPSPDGKWLAFTSNQYGNNDVFALNIGNGEIRQLTFHQSADLVKSWSWDSKNIYFTSSRYSYFGSYSVSVEGGTPIPLFDEFFSTSDELFPMPDGGFVFTNTREVNSQRARKHYKGPYNPDLLYYNPGTDEYKQLTDYEGKDFSPTIDSKGNIYYVSDQGNSEYNLYKLTNGKPEELTRFDTSVKDPFVSADGQKVVFEKGYQLFLFDTASKTTSKISFTAPSLYKLNKEESFDTDEPDAFDISPDGKKMAFISRGVLFVSNTDGDFITEIHNDGERILEVKWFDDNENMLIAKTNNGFPNLYKISAKTGKITRITNELKSNRHIILNADKTHAVYLSGRDEVRLLDLKTLTSKTLAKDEIWAFQNSEPGFSPDGKYVVFTAYRNFEQDIFIHNIAENKTLNLTHTAITEADPNWSPDGKYIYFSSNRTEPSYPFGMRDPSIYRLALDWYADDFQTEGFEVLFEEEEEKTDKKKKGKDKKDKEEKNPIQISINTEGLKDRVELVSKRFGGQYYPKSFKVKENTIVFYNSNEDGGTLKLFKKTYEPYKEAKEEKVSDEAMKDIVFADDKLYYLTDKGIYTYNPEGNKSEKINLKHHFEKNLEKEFHQMFEETWAGLDENFYDESFHGRDWPALKEKFRQYLPHVKNRDNLRILLNDMLGELNSSHLGFNSKGDEEKTRLTYHTAETGIIFDKENPYQVERLVSKSPAMAVRNDIKKGDILTEVNGVKVDFQKNREYYFASAKENKELKLQFERNGQKKEVNVKTISADDLRMLLYDEWIANNRKNVKDWSNDRIAYSYMKNMTLPQLESFLLDMVDKANDRDGLILDLRFNLGGNVHDKVLNFLSQKPYLQWKYREGEKTIQGNFGPGAKPIVLLINQASLSDAEMTTAGFKALNLGKVIGMPTYRWIIFTSAKSLVDGSTYRIPAWGVYTLDGQNLEFTGAEPDIRIDNTFRDYLKGNDPQLKRAVDEILRDLK